MSPQIVSCLAGASSNPTTIGKRFPSEFKLATVDHRGNVLTEPMHVDSVGWEEATDWVTIPSNVCVAWPSVHVDAGPHVPYGSWDADPSVSQHWSKTLRIALYCEEGGEDLFLSFAKRAASFGSLVTGVVVVFLSIRF